jgi:hypothetical protein
VSTAFESSSDHWNADKTAPLSSIDEMNGFADVHFLGAVA